MKFAQIEPSFAVPEFSVTAIDGVGKAFTVMVLFAEPEQPFAFVTVTVYVAVDVGLGVMEAVVAPVDQA